MIDICGILYAPMQCYCFIDLNTLYTFIGYLPGVDFEYNYYIFTFIYSCCIVQNKKMVGCYINLAYAI